MSCYYHRSIENYYEYTVLYISIYLKHSSLLSLYLYLLLYYLLFKFNLFAVRISYALPGAQRNLVFFV